MTIIGPNISSDHLQSAFSEQGDNTVIIRLLPHLPKFDVMCDVIVGMYMLTEGTMSIYFSDLPLVYLCT